MKDNLLFLLAATTLVGGALYDNSEYTPATAVWFQEGRSVQSTPAPVQDPIQDLVRSPGPVSHIVDMGPATGPPLQDDYPRTPSEIRAVLQQQRNFGLIQP